ncbi:aminopeptidase [Lacticaseibacillus jixianensis]|uniref:Aminopeptidase n=1 Tax=Lacticaseibacillus jixianensis TaxID=2486012 RepID=A0ABW4BA64_9LACO|nr:aminopeptidase [Lacticaseibacillus jixianensis]
MTLPNFPTLLAKYAALAVDVGVGVKPGDTVYLQISTDQLPLAHQIIETAYARGAAEVAVWWQDDFAKRQDILHLADDRLNRQPPQVKAMFTDWLSKDAKRITVHSSDPDNLAGVDPARVAAYQQAFQQSYAPLSNAISSNAISWTIIGAASPQWAAKVFPDEAPAVATDKLWDAIFKTVRIYEPDPEAAWVSHEAKLRDKAAWLNAEQFDALHYQAPGTDLTVGLPAHHVWNGGSSTNPRGEVFTANMPTEEVFTAPDNRRIDGTVASTKPLSYSGSILQDMHFRFKAGQVVAAEAGQGNAVLQHLLAINGARSLGEISLVPDPSPISQSGLIFYSTLFDENASDHMALGMAYPFSIEGGTALSPAELTARGLNVADTHVDFMMGSAKMNIDGIKKDGSIKPIFRNGDWA